jgi:hypothetical protein
MVALSAVACRSLLAKPKFRLRWSQQQPKDVRPPRVFDSMQPAISPHYRSAQRQWLHWQLKLLLGAVHPLLKLLHQLGLGAPQDVAAAAAPAAAGDATAAATAAGSSGSQRLHSRFKWDYLSQQLPRSSIWTTAISALDSKWSSGLALLAGGQQGDVNTAEESVDVGQLYADAVQLCRALASAAPLPLICNNPQCTNLARASEKALATKQCAGCRCRYCSAECQRADWKRHRPACKAMASSGLVCD